MTSPDRCFFCGGTLTVIRWLCWYCPRCEAFEEHGQYFPQARMLEAPAGEWKGTPYLDHSLGYHPSP